eukprot:CAMPEP_0194311832 /NCGR_PEP_ID=MMETSP0171-20130528/8750_1 /TAXON_ID=218684 /ORGANISM="Corethron pennatum, Strain L29A3" /LENGTH=577 /DNA_ID=CAMNT_0039066063 /DNA_START=34 /DNA_END=1764 /DNA_ORIENTATION=+
MGRKRTLGLSNIFGTIGIKNKNRGTSETQDKSADALTYVGEAVYDALKFKHAFFHHQQWNVTFGKVVGKLQHTPRDAWTREDGDVKSGHDDWFPEKIGEIIGRTEVWCDVLSLAPPDGLFLEEINKALRKLSQRSIDEGEVIVVRMMFGNLPAMPVNCDNVIKKLTYGIPNDDSTNLRLWVGAWRKGLSWNHAKIIAVDGQYLHTGGHNLWDPHYLKHDPVHDLSIEMEGGVAYDGHRYADAQWEFIAKKQHTVVGWVTDKIPDNVPMTANTRVTVSEFPKGVARKYPDNFDIDLVHRPWVDEAVPVITIGRYGAMNWKARPADDAILAMIDSARKSIRMALQDLGPVCLPNTKIPLPGLVWPKKYMNALAQAIWSRDVQVEIVLSHPNSMPGGLGPTEANYGNGWTCVDVAAYIIKRITKTFPGAADLQLRKNVEENLRVCFIKQKIGRAYSSGMQMGMHAKHFIIDDKCAYIGSQNLYVCDLAEWGVVVDNEKETKKMMEEYWNPMWKASYMGDDCPVQEVMDGLHIERDPEANKKRNMFPVREAMDGLHIERDPEANKKNNMFHKQKKDDEEMW